MSMVFYDKNKTDNKHIALRKYAFYFYIENLVFPRVAGSKMDQDFLI